MRARADIANTALRIFLQEIGELYDIDRGLEPYNGKKHFNEIRTFFGDRCCYCYVELTAGVQDHLIPMNKKDLGLHAWGNIVPACHSCNAKKQGREWKDFIIERAGSHVADRHAHVHKFLAKYKYAPTYDLRDTAEELYEEVGSIAITLISAKIKRVKKI